MAQGSDSETTKKKKTSGSKVLVWILLIMLIVGLAGFGATNFGGRLDSIGSVGETEISVDDYARELQQELRAFSAQTGRPISIAEAQALGLDRAVLARVVGRAALDEAARLAGLSVGDEIVRREILRTPAFQGLAGGFDRETYKFVLERNGLSVTEFEEDIRADTARSILEAAVIRGVQMPDIFTDTLFDYARQTRDISWARLGPGALSAPLPEPTEAELAAFHEANPELFTEPETRRIAYAWLTPDMMLDEVAPSEEELRALYQERIDDYRLPERRLVERLVFESPEAAENAAARLASGEIDFEGLVAERGLTLDDIDLGEVTRADLGPAAETVFALTEPGVTGVAQTDLGPAIFRVNAVLNARETPFEQARDELVAELSADRAARAVAERIDEVDDLLAGGATLEDVAAETPLELGRIDYRAGTEDGIAAYPAFREAAASVAEGDFPEVIELDDGGIFALRLEEIVPPRVQPLDEVREAVRAAWTEQETGRRLADQARSLAALIGDGGTGEDAPQIGLEQVTGVARDGTVEGAPPALVDRVFEMQPGEVAVIEEPGAAVLVRLDAIHAADGGTAEARTLKEAFAAQASDQLAQDVLTAFTVAQQFRGGIRLDQAAIAAVNAQLSAGGG